MTPAYEKHIALQWKVPVDRALPLSPDPSDPRLPAPPLGTRRTYLPTPHGSLELLYALPHGASLDLPADPAWKRPVLFQHGGFGSANCYSNFLPWFAARGYPAYSLSLRGHGYSWYPGYWAMAFTSKSELAKDVAIALAFIQSHHPSGMPMALVGHSAGGGLCQHLVDSGKGVGVGKLVIIAGFPCYGGWRVYVNWFKNDPWFSIRMLKDLCHMCSPLSTTHLVHRAFFSPTYSINKVRAFENEMAPYESMAWPCGMMLPFVSCARVLSHLFAGFNRDEGSIKPHTPLLVLSGAQDMLMRDPLMRRMAQMYAATKVGIGYGSEPRDVSELQYQATNMSKASDTDERRKEKVWFAKIAAPGAGHNLMRDDGWERCARVIEAFLEN